MALYINVDVHFPNDRKVLNAGVLAELLYLRALCWSRENLTDGFIHREALPVVAARFTKRQRESARAALVGVGLWIETPEGWAVPAHVWRRWNPTAAEITAQREADNDRKREWRAARRERDEGPNRRASRARRERDVAPEPKPEPEPEPEMYLRSPPLPSATGRARRGGRGGDESLNIATALDEIVGDIERRRA